MKLRVNFVKAFMAVAFIIGSVNVGSAYIPYKVSQGETMFRICRNNKITIDQLIAFNPILAEKGLQAGMTIKIPEGSELIEIDKSNEKVYFAANKKSGNILKCYISSIGQTLESIANETKTPIKLIKEYNPELKSGVALKEGTVVRLSALPNESVNGIFGN